MPYCPSCGREVAEDASFCPSCGKTLTPTSNKTPTPAANAHVPPANAPKLYILPTWLKKNKPAPRQTEATGVGFCPNCGRAIGPDAAFCPNCGKALNVAPSQTATTPIAPAPRIPSTSSVGFCPHCGKAIAQDALFCPGCGKSLTAVSSQASAPLVSSAPSPSTYAPVSPPVQKNETNATILSIIPGIGQMWVGRTPRGLAILIGFVIVAYFTPVVSILPGLVYWVWNIYDAHSLAKTYNALIASTGKPAL